MDAGFASPTSEEVGHPAAFLGHFRSVSAFTADQGGELLYTKKHYLTNHCTIIFCSSLRTYCSCEQLQMPALTATAPSGKNHIGSVMARERI